MRTVLRRALARDPADRFHAIADARIELLDPVRAVADRRPAGLPVRLAVPAALVAIGLAGRLWFWPRAAHESLLCILDLGGEPVEAAVISPDGRSGAAVRDGCLFVRRLDAELERPMEGVEDVDARFTLCWSPDSRHVGFATVDELFRVPADGGASTRRCGATRSRCR